MPGSLLSLISDFTMNDARNDFGEGGSELDDGASDPEESLPTRENPGDTH